MVEVTALNRGTASNTRVSCAAGSRLCGMVVCVLAVPRHATVSIVPSHVCLPPVIDQRVQGAPPRASDSRRIAALLRRHCWQCCYSYWHFYCCNYCFYCRFCGTTAAATDTTASTPTSSAIVLH